MKKKNSSLFSKLTTDFHTGVNAPVNDSSTFFFKKAQDMQDTFKGEQFNYLYARHWNPNNYLLGKQMAKLEKTEAAWPTASGMSAITCTLLQLCKKGDHILCSATIYGGTFALLKNLLPLFGISCSFIDLNTKKALKNGIKKNTKVIYTETMANPTLEIANLKMIGKVAKQKEITFVVDNTFTPYIIQPKKFGADVIIHSLTKYINGMGDKVAGVICSTNEFINRLIDVNNGVAMLTGPVLDAHTAQHVFKNSLTLKIRIKKHGKNALKLAKKLRENNVSVVYPGLEEHSHFNLLKKLKNKKMGFGGLLCIQLKTDTQANEFMETLQKNEFGQLAVSLGYVQTLYSNSGQSTSSELDSKEQKKAGIHPGLVRVSIGIEDQFSTWISLIISTLKLVEK